MHMRKMSSLRFVATDLRLAHPSTRRVALGRTRQYDLRSLLVGMHGFTSCLAADTCLWTKPCMTLRTLNYGNYGIFLIMGNAGFCPSTV